MQRIGRCVPGFLLWSFSFAPAGATPVGVAELENNTGWSAVYSSVRLQLSIRDRFSAASLASILDLLVGPSDVGMTVTIVDNPQFFDRLTNGQNEAILLGVDPGLPGYGGPPYSGGSGPLVSEARAFFGDDTGAHGIDFAGFTITSVVFRLTELHLDTPGMDPNGDGIWTDHVVNATLTVNAEPVPEPATLLLVGFSYLFLSALSIQAEIAAELKEKSLD